MRKLLLTLACVLALSSIAGLAGAATVNIIEGTNCNNWTLNVHDGLGNPDNTRCNTEDLRGTSTSDTIYGYQGWDYIVSGNGGDDLLLGGGGMDALYAGDGNDTLSGSSGHDHAWGGAGDDTINISDGRDEVDRVEEVHGDFRDKPDGVDDCTLDNDVGDKVEGCERITVVNADGSTITFASGGAVPSGVLVTVR